MIFLCKDRKELKGFENVSVFRKVSVVIGKLYPILVGGSFAKYKYKELKAPSGGSSVETLSYLLYWADCQRCYNTHFNSCMLKAYEAPT